MGEFSLSHILIVAVIFLIFFRKDQLPTLGKSIGKAIRGFKEGLNEIEVDAKDIHDDPVQIKKPDPQQNPLSDLKATEIKNNSSEDSKDKSSDKKS